MTFEELCNRDPLAFDEGVVRDALSKATSVTVREDRVTITKRRKDVYTGGFVERSETAPSDVLVAHKANKLFPLLPRRGRNSIPVAYA